MVMSSKRAAHNMMLDMLGVDRRRSYPRIRKPARTRVGAIQQKVLLLLRSGIQLPLQVTTRGRHRVLRELRNEWNEIDKESLNRAIEKLYRSRLVTTQRNADGTLTLVLSGNGKKRLLSYDTERMTVRKPERWDGKWRLALFDVPAEKKVVRDALRNHLKRMGFYEFQKSVFVHPYPCASEIEFVMELHAARRYLRFIVATEIDNEFVLKKHFQLT